MKKGGAADQCVTDMGGLSMAQRWIFSDWAGDLATHEPGLDMNSTTPNNDDDDVREWGDLHNSTACPIKIKLWGADSDRNLRYRRAGPVKCFADADPVAESFDSARSYQNSADDNQIVNGLTGDEYAIGYFGRYYEENANELSVAAIANNDTHGVQDAETPSRLKPAPWPMGYATLSRYVYMNVNNNDWDPVKASSSTATPRPAWITGRRGLRPLPDAMLNEMLGRGLGSAPAEGCAGRGNPFSASFRALRAIRLRNHAPKSISPELNGLYTGCIKQSFKEDGNVLEALPLNIRHLGVLRRVPDRKHQHRRLVIGPFQQGLQETHQRGRVGQGEGPYGGPLR